MAKWTLSKRFKFEASHQLVHHDGKCARLHGHSWVGYLTVSGHSLVTAGAKANMLMDYGDIGAITKQIEGFLDHQHLNDVLKTEMPTSELVAQRVYAMAKAAFDGELKSYSAYLDAVVIEETCTSRCEYTEIGA